jgi:stage II sporulation protein D
LFYHFFHFHMIGKEVENGGNDMKNKAVAWILLWSAGLLLASMLIPGILVQRWEHSRPVDLPDEPHPPGVNLPADSVLVPVYLTAEQRVEKIPLEAYVRGVVAAEMPPEFELEALKAQAIAARTYIVNRLLEGNTDQVPVENAVVTDTTSHQVYLPPDKLREQWDAAEYQKNLQKYTAAAAETKGLIATYQGRPISAAFFSTSNGYTENSEDYWDVKVPYLRSVESPWDVRISPKYKAVVRMPLAEVYEKLGISADPADKPEIRVLEWSEGKRIKKISIAGHVFSGREVREKLDLNSSHFHWEFAGGEAEITTFGYGHGVGMSQWGANGMAKEGRTAEEIIRHYFTGVEIERFDPLKKY